MITRERIVEINNALQDVFLAIREYSESTSVYLERRGITFDLAHAFGVGFAPQSSAIDRLDHSVYSTFELMEAGIANDKGRDRFRNRLMFPIHDAEGALVGFGGRAMADDQVPKYLNSPETAAYRKREILYNLNRSASDIRRLGYAILVEGYMDVIGLHRAGVTNTVACSGTSLTTDQVTLLAKYTRRVYLNLDSDEAGMEATVRSARELLRADFDVRVIMIHDAKDPDEYTKKFGGDAYLELIDKSFTFLEWAVWHARCVNDLNTLEGRARCLDFLLPIVVDYARKADTMYAMTAIAEALGVPTKSLCAAMDRTPQSPITTYKEHDLVQALSLSSKLP